MKLRIEGRWIIKNVTVVVDEVGNIPNGHVLIEDSLVSAVDPSLQIFSDNIVIEGEIPLYRPDSRRKCQIWR